MAVAVNCRSGSTHAQLEKEDPNNQHTVDAIQHWTCPHTSQGGSLRRGYWFGVLAERGVAGNIF